MISQICLFCQSFSSFFRFLFYFFIFCSGNKSTISIKLKSINGCTLEMYFVSYLNRVLLSKNALVYIVFVFFVTMIKNTLVSFPFYSISFITLEVISIVSLWKETEFTSLIYTGTGNIMSVVELVQRSTFTIFLVFHLLSFHWTVLLLVLCLFGSHYNSDMEFQSIFFRLFHESFH